MNILIVTEYYFPHIGGLENLFQNLAEGLAREGHRVDVVTCRLAGSQAEEELNGVRIHRAAVPRGGDRYWFTLLAIPKALKYSATSDVVLTTTYNGAFPAWLAARLKKRPVAIFTHEVVGPYWSRIGLSPLMAFIYRRLENAVLSLPFDSFICNSESTLRALVEWGAPVEKTQRVYPGIDYGRFDPKKAAERRAEIRAGLGLDGEFVYTFFGRPGFVKGVEHLVRAVPRIKELIGDSKPLLILSRKPREGYRRVEEILKKSGLKRGEDIIIIDPVEAEELPAYLAASDAVVVPSMSEGFGFTCVEACAMDKPVVASNVASLPEVISGRFVLVEPADPEAIAEGLLKVRSKEYTVSEPKRFFWKDTVAAHLAIFAALLERASKGRA